MLGGIGARSTQDGASARQNTAYGLEAELHRLIFQQPAPSFHEAQELIFIMEAALAHDCPYDCVQSRAVAPARQHSDLHYLLLSWFCWRFQFSLCLEIESLPTCSMYLP